MFSIKFIDLEGSLADVLFRAPGVPAVGDTISLLSDEGVDVAGVVDTVTWVFNAPSLLHVEVVLV